MITREASFDPTRVPKDTFKKSQMTLIIHRADICSSSSTNKSIYQIRFFSRPKRDSFERCLSKMRSTRGATLS